MRPAFTISLRVIGAVGGGYAFSAALVALASTALPLLTRMPRSEAVLLSSLMGFIVYLIALIWAFAERNMVRVWAVFLGVGGLALALTLLLIR